MGGWSEQGFTGVVWRNRELRKAFQLWLECPVKFLCKLYIFRGVYMLANLSVNNAYNPAVVIDQVCAVARVQSIGTV
ncbi:hypothetical protein [Endozoicomonas sp. YOMI1]|uniref:hypothetical protein n=1 Tax=Endozoicomonas sp. YOMI1 TaxID=2828739 RepID=UPI002148EB61|nr:hypothetical protein [Endozoicomonas sp. YOMI1]